MTSLDQIKVEVTEFESRLEAIRSVRERVFIDEQHIDRDLEWDDRDPLCKHALVTIADEPVATGRIDLQKNGKIGRVAVLAEYRRRGLGRRIMEALENFANQQGLEKIWFHAQQSAIPFYLQLGYQTVGDEFMEAEIPHIIMEKPV